ncbi:MAG: hypothetical protein COB60_01295 [Flavobacteriaceae bacterium]|nr:MAG: hypothetical protein COB60_01295 [Flavobacteriaceae bacterium]
MKTNSILEKSKSYLKELTIVIAGVLIALFISNQKENNQLREYHIATIETINNEVKANYFQLKRVIGKHKRLIDSINKYSSENITLTELIKEKGGGVQIATLTQSGLEFYKKNQIFSIDLKMMSRLILMESISKYIDSKMDKFSSFYAPNRFLNSEESKKLVILYLKNILNSEIQLMHTYEDFIDKYVEDEHNEKKNAPQ